MAAEKSNKSKLKENRGIIDLTNPKDYVPWIKTREFTRGEGTRYCIKDFYNGRPIHLMSGLEKDYFLITRWNNKVLEVFEQVPLLPLELTQKISKECGYLHPKNPKTSEDIIMTTDFLILVKRDDGSVEWFARAVKPKKELKKKRIREKLDIEFRYWKNNGIKWAVITEDNINKTFADNIELIRNGFEYKETDKNPINALKYLIASKKILVDMEKKLDLQEIKKIIVEDCEWDE